MPRLSGLTLGYRAVEHGYPVVPCVRALLLLCDEVIANIGRGEDGTREALLALGDPRIRLLEEPWDLGERTKGHLLSRETNRAMAAATGDWALYLQADELLHERDAEPLRAWIARADRRDRVDGLSFRYLHFYGTPSYVQDHPFTWYRRAVRAVKLGRGIESVGDALKFRRRAGGRLRRLRAPHTNVTVYHYGWARPPEVMLRKQRHLDRFWHDDAALARRYAQASPATIYGDLGNLRRFTGTHPAVMREYVAASEWPFDAGLDRQWPRPLRWLRAAVTHPFRRRSPA